MRNIVWVALGGALGATGRYFITSLVERWGGHPTLGILLVNVLGCTLLGFLGTYFAQQEGISPALQIMLTTGFLGALTTYSTFALDTIRLWDGPGAGMATWYVFGHLTLGIAAARIGGWIAFVWLRAA